MITEDLMKLVEIIEKYPVTGASILLVITGSLAFTAKAIIAKIAAVNYKEPWIAFPVFWTIGKKYKVRTVLLQVPRQPPLTDYVQYQYDTPETWKDLITIKSTFFNCRHRIIPKDANARIIVMINRNGVEREKNVYFN